MKTNLILFTACAGLIFQSCTVNFGEKGNGNVVTQERAITESFNSIKSGSGITVLLSPGTTNKIVVEADENIQDLITTEIEDNVLKIGTKKNIRFAKAKKVHVTYSDLIYLDANSGAEISSEKLVKSQNLTLNASSGGTINLEVLSENLTMSASSGADLKISGKAVNAEAKASSGADISAKDLQTVNCVAHASSGASVKVNVNKRISTRASSGGDVTYYGNPEKIESSESSSGSIRKR